MGDEPTKKLTLADLLPRGGVVNVASDSEVTVIRPGFYTCGASCPNPRACLADEHCERGFVGNKIGFTGGYEVSPRDAARALEPEQYAKRDAAFEVWYQGLDLLHKESRTAALRIAFNAGWAARKKAELEMAFGT